MRPPPLGRWYNHSTCGFQAREGPIGYKIARGMLNFA
jgi:hypothetical protein